jgi:hypothetical protein
LEGKKKRYEGLVEVQTKVTEEAKKQKQSDEQALNLAK